MDKKWDDSLKNEKKVTEEDIMGLVKKELPYNGVEIKKYDLERRVSTATTYGGQVSAN